MRIIAIDPRRNWRMDASGPYIPAGFLCDCLNMAGNRVELEMTINGQAVRLFIPGEDTLGMGSAVRASQRMGIVPYTMRGVRDFDRQAEAVIAAPVEIEGTFQSLPSGDTALIFRREDTGLIQAIGSSDTREVLFQIGTDWDLIALPMTFLPFWAIRWDDKDEDRKVVFIDPTPALFGMFPLVRYSSEWVERVNSLVRNAGLGRSMSPSGSLDRIAFSDLDLSLRYAISIAAVVAGVSMHPAPVTIVVEYPYLAYNHERLFHHAIRLAENARWVWGQ